MDAALLFKAAGLIFQFMGSPIWKEMKEIWGYEEELKAITETINFIGRVLCDIESKQLQDESVISGYNRLRQAFLDAEDFLDMVQTHKNKSQTDDRKMKKVRKFFSSKNQAKYAVQVHNEINGHRKNFDAIAQDLQKFGLSVGSMSRPTSKGANEATSFVDPIIIGRDGDKRNVLDLLDGSSSVVKEKIPVVSIIGIGGMGKSTLAQLVFGESSFDMKLWVSDSQKFDLELLLKKILLCISPDDISLHNLGQEQLRNRLVREICGKKFFLVLDDVRNETRKSWMKLEDLLNGGSKDSRILVTTRSRKVADIMGSTSSYELKGLSLADSWQLFERMAFEGRSDEKLIEIGKLIVQKCCQVPLAIKTIACLLFREDIRKWEHVRDLELAKIEEEGNDIIHVLKISYNDLDYALKICFQYCALFPKNAVISRNMLSCIWMANGCIETKATQSSEDVCVDNLKILYNRCFLEEVKRSNCGEVTHFRMHDLMHDLAKEVAGREILVVDSSVLADSSKLIMAENVRHMNLKCIVEMVGRVSTVETKNTRLRTLLCHDIFTWFNPWQKLIRAERLISDYQFVRVLDLPKWRLEILPDSIGKLVHLRYLNLSCNEFKTLPNSIAELWNLQSLLLNSCFKLEELPMGIVKLINLRHLDLDGCNALTSMPSGMGALTYLKTLCKFIVGTTESKNLARLEDLGPLSKLQGDLVIKLPDEIQLKEPMGYGGFLLNKKLKTLKIEWPETRSRRRLENDMDIFAKLQPHSDLEEFTLYGYEGLTFPPWFPDNDLSSVLPNLVSIMIENSSRCQYFPSFSKLVFLKRLTICNLSSLEYIEESVPSGTSFFPALDYLWLMGLENLKGWCRSLATEENDSDQEQYSMLPPFPCLSNLHIYGCPRLRMIFMPLLSMKEFCLKSEDEAAFTLKEAEYYQDQSKDLNATSSFVSLSCKLHTHDANILLSLPWEKHLQRYLDDKPLHLMMRYFVGFNDISTQTNMNEAFKRMSNRLVSLRFHSIPTLRTLPEGVKHLSLLRELHIEDCEEFSFEDGSTCYGDDRDSLWSGLKSLVELRLIELPQMCCLPRGIEFVTSLEVLDCSYCQRLTELPRGICKLIGLKELNFKRCESLTRLPAGFGSLSKLSKFVLNSGYFHREQLEDLSPLWNLQGDLEIQVDYCFLYPECNGAILGSIVMLKALEIDWGFTESTEDMHKLSFEKLQPHSNLKELSLYGYQGKQFPNWMPMGNLASVLPSLERLTIFNSNICSLLPSLSRLPRLTHLEISGLSSLEYIEHVEMSASTPSYFPSLQCVRLVNLPKLKAWWRGVGQPLFSSMSSSLEVHVSGCPLLTMASMPITSIRNFVYKESIGNFEYSYNFLGKLTVKVNESGRGLCNKFSTKDDHFLTSTSWEHYLRGDSASLCIDDDFDLFAPGRRMSKVLTGMSHCLTSLKIINCRHLRTLPKEVENLTNVRELHVESCRDFMFNDEEETHLTKAPKSLEIGESSSSEIICQEGEIPWEDQFKYLESLTLKHLPIMVRLPDWIQCVSSFQRLEIVDCINLVVPAWVRETFHYEKLNSSDEETDLFMRSS